MVDLLDTMANYNYKHGKLEEEFCTQHYYVSFNMRCASYISSSSTISGIKKKTHPVRSVECKTIPVKPTPVK
jgi:hypothetical protein